MPKSLFISQWYPNRYDSMFGLFVKKHAEAVSQFCEVKVLYVFADEKIQDFEITEQKSNNLSEIIVYYPFQKQYGLLCKFIKTINYLKAYSIGFKRIKASGFIPDVVHANILTRTGLIAFIHKIFTKTPYVITEHWSRYLPESNGFRGNIRKIVTRQIVKHASAVLPVSNILKEAMWKHKLQNSNYKVIGNVVDDCFFTEFPVLQRTKKRIVHVSCFDEKAKNISGILRVIGQLSKIRSDFELILIGTGQDFEEIYNYAQSLNTQKNTIVFLGELSPEKVAYWLNNSDFFVLFSNYETAGVVVAESLICGKPVLSSIAGGVTEMVDQSNGILVSVQDETSLFKEMNFMLDHFQTFDSELIKTNARLKFSSQTIGKEIVDVYNRILSRKK